MKKLTVRILAFSVTLLLTLPVLADCLPCKEEIDNGMGIQGATLYADSIAGMLALRPVDRAAPVQYARIVEHILSPLAKDLLAGVYGHLNKEQTATLMAQIDKQCYRALDFRAWSLKTEAQITVATAAWTAKIFEWADEDQKVYTKLAAELKN